MNDPNPVQRGLVVRGGLAGLAGATVLALWFLVMDGLAGRPFHTPAFLFRVLFGAEQMQLVGARVALYTVFHVGAFLAVGIAAAWIVDRLRLPAGVLAGAILGFLLFDLVFYGGVWLTGVDVVRYLGWTEVLSGNVLAGISLFGTLRLLDAERNVSWRDLLAEHEVLREGVVVGLVGAAVVAAWFSIIDGVAGRIFFTPAALGSILFHGATGAGDVRMDALVILGYTALHMAAFLLTGVIAAGIAAAAEDREPYFLFGAVLLFVTFETFFVGVVTIAAQWLLAVIPWWHIAVANLVAAAAMGYYLWTRHPELAAALGRPDLEDVRLDADRAAGAPVPDGRDATTGPAVSPPAEGSSGAGPDRR